jgi:serine/threonine protein kinase
MCKEGKSSEPCHCIIDLDSFGLPGLSGKGCIADESWTSSIAVPCYMSDKDDSYLIYLPNRTLRMLGVLSDGTYGIIQGGERIINDVVQLVVIKKSKCDDTSLLQEALVQKIVGESLKRRGFPLAVSPIYDIFSLRDGSVCFTMEPMKGKTFDTIINDIVTKEIVNQDFLVHTIIECLLQMCSMLWHLTDDIGMNHRDLKPNNIILNFLPKSVDKKLTIGNKSMTIKSKFDVIFVDFGFSCIGDFLKLGRVYHPSDPCPKDGRDLFMFLAFLYILVYKELPYDLNKLFVKWLSTDNIQIKDILKSDTIEGQQEAIKQIYYYAGKPDMLKFCTTPLTIFLDLYKLKTK